MFGFLNIEWTIFWCLPQRLIQTALMNHLLSHSYWNSSSEVPQWKISSRMCFLMNFCGEVFCGLGNRVFSLQSLIIYKEQTDDIMLVRFFPYVMSSPLTFPVPAFLSCYFFSGCWEFPGRCFRRSPGWTPLWLLISLVTANKSLRNWRSSSVEAVSAHFSELVRSPHTPEPYSGSHLQLWWVVSVYTEGFPCQAPVSRPGRFFCLFVASGTCSVWVQGRLEMSGAWCCPWNNLQLGKDKS